MGYVNHDLKMYLTLCTKVQKQPLFVDYLKRYKQHAIMQNL